MVSFGDCPVFTLKLKCAKIILEILKKKCDLAYYYRVLEQGKLIQHT